MSKKGFTLVELLAVIIILFFLVILVLPNITNSVKKNEEKTNKLMLDMIVEAGELFISDNEADFSKINGNVYCITLSKLVELEYLKSPINYDGEDISGVKSLEVTYNDDFEFKLIDKNSCVENK